jgi:hypothetical protein
MGILDSLFEPFNFNDFFSVESNYFNRPVKDMKPFYCKKVKDGWVIVANALGVAKDNLKVTVEKSDNFDQITGANFPALHICGTSKIAEIDFENKIDLSILLEFRSKIKAVSYTTKDGLVYVKLTTEEQPIDTISAQYTDDLGIATEALEGPTAEASKIAIDSSKKHSQKSA